MDAISYIPDQRINAVSVIVEMSTSEYLNTAKNILKFNVYQRKRVIKSAIAEILKTDLRRGCTIPPIVLAIKSNNNIPGFDINKFRDFEFIKNAFLNSDLLIIDGLQRTYVMSDLEKELLNEGTPDINTFYNQRIRVELYIGLDRLGILYRMLTLNTGQTTMSTRHLMEILYYDLFEKEINGMRLIMDKEDEPVTKDSFTFSFKEALDGYYSFVEGKEIPVERSEILDNIKTLKNLEKTENEKRQFQDFLKCYSNLLTKLIELLPDELVVEEFPIEYRLTGPPFGKDVINVFKKSQSITGFGAAMFSLFSQRNITIDILNDNINNISISSDSKTALISVVKSLDKIRNKSNKVGNDQRYFFRVLFRTLFDPEEEFPFDLNNAIEKADIRVTERLYEEYGA